MLSAAHYNGVCTSHHVDAELLVLEGRARKHTFLCRQRLRLYCSSVHPIKQDPHAHILQDKA